MQLFGFSFYTTSLENFSKKLIKVALSKNKKAIKVLPASMNDVVKSFFSDNLFNAIVKFDYVVADGMPLVWLEHWKGKKTAVRLYGPEFMDHCLADSNGNRKIKHFFYGCNNHTINKLKQNVLKKYPKVNIVGSISPPYRDLTVTEEEKYFTLIKKSQANIIWISLGGEKQVLFIDKVASKLPGVVIIAIGAAFDFLSFNKKQAPIKIRKAGFEWLYRLIQEPRRLWRRYILQIPLFIVFLLLECLNLYLPTRRKFLCLRKRLILN